MTDTATPTQPDETAERRGPGRPRIPAVIERDNSVLQWLKEHDGVGQVRAIAEGLNVPKNLTYLSLWRLRKQGLVAYARDGASRTWSVS